MYPSISQSEFQKIQKFMLDEVGVTLSDNKKSLVVGRLGRRLRHYGFESFDKYFSLIENDENPEERQVMIDLLTTHETYFFREEAHFKFLQEYAKHKGHTGEQFRVWSAACSSGEEPYSIAMALAEVLNLGAWSVISSDVSLSSVEAARQGLYSHERVSRVPKTYLTKYFLKGVRAQEGKYLINKNIRRKINFIQLNLNSDIPDIGMFDVIFLRNILIYFEIGNKKKIVTKVIQHLKPGGYLVVSHSETLNGVSDRIAYVKPSLYRKRPDSMKNN